MPARIQFRERRVSLGLADLSPSEASGALAVFAKEQLAQVIADGEAPDTYVRFVDGRKDAPEESVRPSGVILYEFAVLPEIARAALDYLGQHAPVLTGAYRDSFFATIDGRRWDPSSDPAADVTEIIVTNDQPYSRKIEVGGMQVTTGGHHFDHAQTYLRSLYGQVAKITVTFVELEGGYVLRGSSGRRRGRRAGDPMTYPSLSITLK